jgi:prephenate dehydrogenase
LKVAVLGVGLIGGSIGLAARARAGAQVSGWDPGPDACARALALGAIDAAADDIAGAVEDADVVFVAAPVSALVQTVRTALDSAGPETVVTDVGSTKRLVVETIADPRFVAGHPLAGSVLSGVEHAHKDLFEGATWYLSPADSTPEILNQRLHRLIVSFGAEPVPIDADMHDKLMASVSQLPHVLANLLVAQVAGAHKESDRPELLRTSGIGPSFRDAARVAGSNSAIWTDIYMSNRDALIDAIDELVERLQLVRGALQAGNAQALTAWNERARTERETLLGSGS